MRLHDLPQEYRTNKATLHLAPSAARPAAYAREGLRDIGFLAACGAVAVLADQRPDQAIVVNPEVYR
jgi:hypothetical protein